MNSRNDGEPHRSSPNLLTIQQFCEVYPAFRPGGIRAMLFHRGQDAEDAGAVARFGRKILIDEAAFLSWVKAGGARRIAGRG